MPNPSIMSAVYYNGRITVAAFKNSVTYANFKAQYESAIDAVVTFYSEHEQNITHKKNVRTNLQSFKRKIFADNADEQYQKILFLAKKSMEQIAGTLHISQGKQSFSQYEINTRLNEIHTFAGNHPEEEVQCLVCGDGTVSHMNRTAQNLGAEDLLTAAYAQAERIADHVITQHIGEYRNEIRQWPHGGHQAEHNEIHIITAFKNLLSKEFGFAVQDDHFVARLQIPETHRSAVTKKLRQVLTADRMTSGLAEQYLQQVLTHITATTEEAINYELAVSVVEGLGKTYGKHAMPAVYVFNNDSFEITQVRTETTAVKAEMARQIFSIWQQKMKGSENQIPPGGVTWSPVLLKGYGNKKLYHSGDLFWQEDETEQGIQIRLPEIDLLGIKYTNQISPLQLIQIIRETNPRKNAAAAIIRKIQPVSLAEINNLQDSTLTDIMMFFSKLGVHDSIAYVEEYAQWFKRLTVGLEKNVLADKVIERFSVEQLKKQYPYTVFHNLDQDQTRRLFDKLGVYDSIAYAEKHTQWFKELTRWLGKNVLADRVTERLTATQLKKTIPDTLLYQLDYQQTSNFFLKLDTADTNSVQNAITYAEKHAQWFKELTWWIGKNALADRVTELLTATQLKKQNPYIVSYNLDMDQTRRLFDKLGVHGSIEYAEKYNLWFKELTDFTENNALADLAIERLSAWQLKRLHPHVALYNIDARQARQLFGKLGTISINSSIAYAEEHNLWFKELTWWAERNILADLVIGRLSTLQLLALNPGHIALHNIDENQARQLFDKLGAHGSMAYVERYKSWFNRHPGSHLAKEVLLSLPEADEHGLNNALPFDTKPVSEWEKPVIHPLQSDKESRFTGQLIIQLENEKAVSEAAARLASKYPEKSVLVQLDAQGHYRVVYGAPSMLRGALRWQLVGHGRYNEGLLKHQTLGGLTPVALTEKLGRFSQQFSTEQNIVNKPDYISLVGCSLASSDGSETSYAEQFARAMDKQGIRADISARQVRVAVDMTGRKITQGSDGVWQHKISADKLVLSWNIQGELVPATDLSIRLKSVTALMETLKSGNVKLHQLNTHQLQVLADFFPTRNGNINRLQVLRTLMNKRGYQAWVTEAMQFQQIPQFYRQLNDLTGRQALQQTQAWTTKQSTAIDTWRKAYQNQVTDGVNKNLYIVAQGLYLNHARSTSQQAMTLGLAWLAVLGTEGENGAHRFLAGLDTYIKINEQRSLGPLSKHDQYQVTAFCQRFEELKNGVLTTNTDIFTQQPSLFTTSNEGDYLVKAGQHILALSDRREKGQRSFYMYDPDGGEISFAGQDDAASRHARDNALQQWLVSKKVPVDQVKSWQVNSRRARENLAPLYALLTDFRSESTRMIQAPDVELNGIKLPPFKLALMGAMVDGHPLAAIHLQKADWQEKLSFSPHVLMRFLANADEKSVQEGLYLLKTTQPIQHTDNNRSQQNKGAFFKTLTLEDGYYLVTSGQYQLAVASRTGNDGRHYLSLYAPQIGIIRITGKEASEGISHMQALVTMYLQGEEQQRTHFHNIKVENGQWLFNVKSVTVSQLQQTFSELNLHPAEVQLVSLNMARMKQVSSHLSIGLQAYGYLSAIRRLIHYQTILKQSGLTSRERQELQFQRDLATTSFGVNIGVDLAQAGFLKLSNYHNNIFSGTASAPSSRLARLALKSGSIKLAYFGNPALGALTSCFDFYEAYASLSNLSDSTDQKIRQDLIINGVFAVVGGVTGISLPVAGIALSGTAAAAYLGPVGVAIGISLIAGQKIYQAVRVVEEIEKYRPLRTDEKFLTGLREFFGLEADTSIINNVTHEQARRQIRETYDRLLEEQAKSFFITHEAAEAFYFSSGKISLKEKRYKKVVGQKAKQNPSNWQGDRTVYYDAQTTIIMDKILPGDIGKLFHQYKSQKYSGRPYYSNLKIQDSEYTYYIPNHIQDINDEVDANFEDGWNISGEVRRSEFHGESHQVPELPDGRYNRQNERRVEVWFSLGEGHDKAQGKRGRKNVFEVDSGKKQFTGADLEDSFLLIRKTVFMNKSLSDLSLLDGGGGEDTVMLFDKLPDTSLSTHKSYLINLHESAGYVAFLPGTDTGINGAEEMFSRLHNIEHATGHQETDDILIGNQKDNRLNGLGGKDKLYGYEGNDVLTLQAGYANGGTGIDIYNILPNTLETEIILEDVSGESSNVLLDCYANAFQPDIRLENNDAVLSLMNKNNTLTSLRFKNAYRITGNNEKVLQHQWLLYSRDGLLFELPSEIMADKQQRTMPGQIKFTDHDDYIELDYDGQLETQELHAGDGNDIVIDKQNSDRGGGESTLTLYGESGHDTLIMESGDNVFDGGSGNDFLSGGTGNDIYRFAAGDGQDIIEDTGGQDHLYIAGISHDKLLFSKDESHLVINIRDSEDRITILEAFKDQKRHVEQLSIAITGKEKTCCYSLSALIEAMACFNNGENVMYGLHDTGDFSPILNYHLTTY